MATENKPAASDKPSNGFDGPIFGLVIKVTDLPESNEVGDAIFIKGVVQNTVPGLVDMGQAVTVNLDAGKNLESSRANLNKGGDIDSILFLDRCRLNKDDNGELKLSEDGTAEISSGYMRNVISGTGFGKRSPQGKKHATREVIAGMVDCPTISFKYDGSLGGSEGYLHFPISAKHHDFKFNVGGELKTVRINEEFVKNTIRADYLARGTAAARISFNCYETDKAISVTDTRELQEAIVAALESYGKRGVALVRVVDGESGEVLALPVFNKGWGDTRTDPTIIAETFISNNQIAPIAGDVIEVIPGVSEEFFGKSEQTIKGKLMEHYLNGSGKVGENSVRDIEALGFTKSGADNGKFAPVAFGVEPSELVVGYLFPVVSAMPLLRGALYSAEEIPTVNISIAVKLTDEPVVAAEPVVEKSAVKPFKF